MSFKAISLLTSMALNTLVNASSAPTPAPTPAPTLPELLQGRQEKESTNYFSIYETPIPNDSYYLGIGQAIFSTGTQNYWIGCTQNPYTISAGYAGCGFDDLYTRCVGNIAKAEDGVDITCRTSLGYTCVTNMIYDDLDATDYISWIKCGESGYETALVRTPTGSTTTLTGVEAMLTSAATTSNRISSESSSSTSTTTSGRSVNSVTPTTTSSSSGPSLVIPMLVVWVSTLAVLLAV